MDLEGASVIITGAASGIGSAVASVVRERGASVIGVDRNPVDDVDEYLHVDLLDPASVDELIRALPTGAAGLCNIAGVAPSRPAAEVLTVNLLALQRLTLGMVPKLADGASIVNLASMAGNGWRENLDQVQELLSIEWNGIDRLVENLDLTDGPRSYFLSKEAVIVWTMQHRWTWRDRGIRMNCVSPGPIETPILPDFLEMLGERAQESVRNMDRHGKPEDVAPVVAFLLSDEAAWFRGANLTPDGGMGSHLALKSFGLQ
ncbi:MAG: coniferyl-alcohol dehydrogenase [Acidimicrobiia bacterium]|nr:coniferyl-alcohol dehydrogenase [Acidimicrobiia bacterium]NNL28313.1 coniferyl-alcohol dehydrogenase [Acidimicrobiia bacterium]NNL47145.1 coniferyl-alcohol dehydrogenase [Acidimicrobiia bacterium]